DAASRAWVEGEDHHVAIGSGGYAPDPRWQDDEVRVTFATLVTHYWSHAAVCDPTILHRMSLLAGIPGFVVHWRRDVSGVPLLAVIPGVLGHGRRDVSGPVIMPSLLYRVWPGSELVVADDEGHGGPGMVDARTAANHRLADRLGGISGSAAPSR